MHRNFRMLGTTTNNGATPENNPPATRKLNSTSPLLSHGLRSGLLASSGVSAGAHAHHGGGPYEGKIAGLYDLEETLGRGHFAVVKLAKHVFTGEKVAVKVIDKSKLDEVSKAHLFQEVRCMKLVQHPNVVRLYEVIDTATKLYLILELGDGGDLYDYIMRHDQGLSEQVAKEYFRQIVRAISYCHQLHVVHRDLKPENVVFFEKLGVVKLTDFGFSNKFCPGQKLETSCGSLAYSAPEILLGDSYDAPAVDIWSLGVILYMLVCGQAPFQEANDSETLTMIMDCKYSVPPYVSTECQDLIARMLVRNPEKRATLSEIANHPWLTVGHKDTPPAEIIPLVSREQLSDEDHNFIVQKIVNGNIATKEEIQECLDKNEYNHITATYYLLAERKLKSKRLDQASKSKRPEHLAVQQNLSVPKKDSNSTGTNPSLLTVPRTPGDIPQRARKCSIVQEDDEEEDISNCSGREELVPPLNRRGSRSEGRLNLALQERLAESDKRSNHSKPIVAVALEKSEVRGEPSSSSLLLKNSASKIDSDDITRPNNFYENYQESVLPGGAPILARRMPKFSQVSAGGGGGAAYFSNKLNRAALQARICNRNLNPTSTSNTGGRPTSGIGVDDDTVTTILTDSSTVQIPSVTLSGEFSASSDAALSKFKTMPAGLGSPPSRQSGNRSGSPLHLNEIFEEGADDRDPSSPRPSSGTTRHFVRNHHHQHHSSRTSSYEQRRSKFHKARTASCSSSDASDDDSEKRKKRAHKLNEAAGTTTTDEDSNTSPPTSARPFQQGRRDSHDDSSDSQEPGTGTGTCGNSCVAGNASLQNASNTTTQNSDTNNTQQQQQQQDKTNNTGSSGGSGRDAGGGKKNFNKQQINASNNSSSSNNRRHRTSRRKNGETRLRESQSLNRITEVQEDTTSAAAAATLNNSNVIPNNAIVSMATSQQDGATCVVSPQDGAAPSVCGGSVANSSCQTTSNLKQITSGSSNVLVPKPKGLGARIMQGLSINNYMKQRSPSSNAAIDTVNTNSGKLLCHVSRKDGVTVKNDRDGCYCNKKLYCNPNVLQQDEDSGRDSSCNNKLVVSGNHHHHHHHHHGNSDKSSLRKMRVLGKYFQVHKKLCIPSLAFFSTSTHRNNNQRLYKAQSCGSLVRDKITTHHLQHPSAAHNNTLLHHCRQRAVSVIRGSDSNFLDDEDDGSDHQQNLDRNTGNFCCNNSEHQSLLHKKSSTAMHLNNVCTELTGICGAAVHIGQATKCCSFC